jgi:two-component system OmpR family response regulator
MVSSNVLRFASLTIDLIEQRVIAEGREIELQPMQFRILAYLVAQGEREVSSHELVDRLFRTAQQRGSSNVRSQILKLRRRLGSGGPRIITTPAGWRLSLPLPSEEPTRHRHVGVTTDSVDTR